MMELLPLPGSPMGMVGVAVGEAVEAAHDAEGESVVGNVFWSPSVILFGMRRRLKQR